MSDFPRQKKVGRNINRNIKPSGKDPRVTKPPSKVSREAPHTTYRTDKQTLAREVEIETYRAGGPGGQHRNVTDSAVRLRHRPSGIQVVAADSRSQHQNRETAFLRLIARLEQLNKKPKRRIPTKKSKGGIERRLTTKKSRGTVKTLRKPIQDKE